MGFEVNLQNELVAGVAAVEFGARESELSLGQGGRSRVPVAHLSQCLLVVRHGVHALEHTGNTCYTTVCRHNTACSIKVNLIRLLDSYNVKFDFFFFCDKNRKLL